MNDYDYIIVGGGVCGCSTAFELSTYTKNILLIDKNSDVAQGASGAAGAFLSPLLGKPNPFKDLVTSSLKYSTEFYQTDFANHITTCGTTRIPKNTIEQEKFESYSAYMDFEFQKDSDGYFFKIGSVVDSFGICKSMTKNIQTKFNYEAKSLEYKDGIWIINDELKTKNIILTTGYETKLLDQFYLNIRAVWGRRIDVLTSTQVPYNYHKECSISKSTKQDDRFLVSIGATHHRDKSGVEDIEQNHQELLEKASEIIKLENIEIIKDYCGARASSVDYFPMVGELIDSEATIEEFPYLKNGTNVESKRYTRYKNLFILNGVGGRGFVLSPYLAKKLVDYIIDATPIEENITVDRLFKREVRKIK
jgi:glycine/D-amino acid oxidase-like deaminating enzyme